jgi:lambda repressor-like predicted transcriptional regulator
MTKQCSKAVVSLDQVSSELPPIIRRLEKLVRASGAMLISAVWGGRFLHFPEKVDSSHPLFSLIGSQSFEKLCEAFGGGAYYIPPMEEIEAKLRKDEIRKLARKGLSLKEISDIVEISPEYIKDVVQKEKRKIR